MTTSTLSKIDTSTGYVGRLPWSVFTLNVIFVEIFRRRTPPVAPFKNCTWIILLNIVWSSSYFSLLMWGYKSFSSVKFMLSNFSGMTSLGFTSFDSSFSSVSSFFSLNYARIYSTSSYGLSRSAPCLVKSTWPYPYSVNTSTISMSEVNHMSVKCRIVSGLTRRLFFGFAFLLLLFGTL